MVGKLEKVGNNTLLETLKTADRLSDQFNEARKEIDIRITKSKGRKELILIGAKTAAIMENMGVSTQKEYIDQLTADSKALAEFKTFKKRDDIQGLDANNALILFKHEKVTEQDKAAFAMVQEEIRSFRSSTVDDKPDAPNLHERQSSSSNKATAQPAQRTEEMPKELTDILTPLDKLAKNKDLGLYIGEDNARKFKEKMEEINIGLGGGGLPQENKQAFLKSRLGELDKFCDKQMEKIPTSGFKQFAKVIKHAVVAAISSIKGGLEHEKNMQKLNPVMERTFR